MQNRLNQVASLETIERGEEREGDSMGVLVTSFLYCWEIDRAEVLSVRNAYAVEFRPGERLMGEVRVWWWT
jgi:hypothetical protein